MQEEQAFDFLFNKVTFLLIFKEPYLFPNELPDTLIIWVMREQVKRFGSSVYFKMHMKIQYVHESGILCEHFF